MPHELLMLPQHTLWGHYKCVFCKIHFLVNWSSSSVVIKKNTIMKSFLIMTSMAVDVFDYQAGQRFKNAILKRFFLIITKLYVIWFILISDPVSTRSSQLGEKIQFWKVFWVLQNSILNDSFHKKYNYTSILYYGLLCSAIIRKFLEPGDYLTGCASQVLLCDLPWWIKLLRFPFQKLVPSILKTFE